ncbi:hypothetical protein GOV05_05500 [Candidatus Woesearchaeota archaeon]|nr:hypothetical protein [Candidatus Woesearchaeota archaeon]
MLVVLCPKCKNHMKYAPQKKVVNKTKKCVYCGMAFVVYGHRSNRIIKSVC